ncbi:protein SUPPRESSOR OF PHYA-105 1-like [Olea europaea var. sylvestris]|uniref:protein SUPPRESSOR OF PHYA-105 1-like n=1 Tax=Olea europaea var. sylvestris TaxID=158386 RepID=UPI000C1D27BF|nr:protein SUPPRESSOR OF PHYA-105 1-like [Olea europaea var. sylvestris]
MEHSPKEIDESEIVTSEELVSIDANMPTNPTEPEGVSVISSTSFCVSTSSEWRGSSIHAHLSTLEGYALNRDEAYLAETVHPSISPFPVNGAGLELEELTMRNYDYLSPNSSYVSCSTTREGINHKGRYFHELGSHGPKIITKDKDLMSQNKDPLTLISREDLQRTRASFHELKPSSSGQNDKDSSRISSHLTDGYSKESSSRLPLGYDRSKILSSSSFSQFFNKQSMVSKGKNVPNKSPEICSEFHKARMGQNKDKQTSSSRNASYMLLNKNSLSSQVHSHDNTGKGLELPHFGITLREWLKSEDAEKNRSYRLRLFRRIVLIVDTSHTRGFVLLDISPSSFILLPPDDVKYIGSSLQVELSSVVDQDIKKKRHLLQEMSPCEKFGVKQQKLCWDKLMRHEPQFISRYGVNDKGSNQIIMGISDMENSNYSDRKAHNNFTHEGTSIQGQLGVAFDDVELEKKWYACPAELGNIDFQSNIYSLGLLLFELLWHFESIEAHSAAMLDLSHRILPSNFLSESPKEAAFCFWLLHPDPSSRPTTREILNAQIISGSEEISLGGSEPSFAKKVDDAESDLLIYFLVTLMEQKHDKASRLLENIKFLEADIKEVEASYAFRRSSDRIDGDNNAGQKSFHKADDSFSRTNLFGTKLMSNISSLEDAYFCMRSKVHVPEISEIERSDKDILRSRDRWSWVQNQYQEPTMEEKSVDRVGAFFQGICKFARYSKFEVCGTLNTGDIINSSNVICSLSFDHEENYIATAGVSKKIKIFEFSSLLNDTVDVQYPAIELSNKSKISCVCWNNYIKNYLASADYDGLVQVWDARTGQGLARYMEHQNRAWSVDFSQLDPMKFASGSDDCSIRLWNLNERNSTGTIWTPLVNLNAFTENSNSLFLTIGPGDFGSSSYCFGFTYNYIDLGKRYFRCTWFQVNAKYKGFWTNTWILTEKGDTINNYLFAAKHEILQTCYNVSEEHFQLCASIFFQVLAAKRSQLRINLQHLVMGSSARLLHPHCPSLLDFELYHTCIAFLDDRLHDPRSLWSEC